jgi:processive 1,2-diacylglycerol beta-glucosyltransferase
MCRHPALNGTSIMLVDALDAISYRVRLKRLGAEAYFALTRPQLRWLYSALFNAADSHPDLLGRLSYAVFGRRARRWLRDAKPDVVVSTFPFVTYIVGQAITQEGTRTRLLSLVTDGGRVNRIWFAGHIDVVAVTDDDTDREARLERGRREVVRIDVPLRSQFAGRIDRSVVRDELGLDDRPAVLVWCGGQGLGAGVEEFARELCRRDLSVIPIFVVGSNHRLAKRLARLTWPSRPLIFGQRNDIRRLLGAVDVVVGKAGWISLSEAAAAGLHTVCIDALPGQEDENLRIFSERGAATWAPDARVAVATVCRLIASTNAEQRAAAAGSNEALCEAVVSLMAASEDASPCLVPL